MDAAYSNSIAALEEAFRQDRPATCLTLALAHLATYPDEFRALAYAGRMQRKMSRFEESLELFQRALAAAPPEGRHHIFIELAMLYDDSLRPVEAESWYRKAIECSPDIAGNHIFLGGLFARQGRLSEAEASYRRAILCTHEAKDEAHLNLGLIQRANGQYEEALVSANLALAIDPEYRAALELRDDVQQVIKRRGEA